MKLEKSRITNEIFQKLQAHLKYHSVYDLALDIGISQTTLYRYIQGQEITNEMISKIKRYLDMNN